MKKKNELHHHLHKLCWETWLHSMEGVQHVGVGCWAFHPKFGSRHHFFIDFTNEATGNWPFVGNFLISISPNNHKYFFKHVEIHRIGTHKSFLYDRLPPASRCIEKFDGKTNPTLILWENQKYIYGCCIFPTREASHVLLCELQQISESAQSDNLAHNKHLSVQ